MLVLLFSQATNGLGGKGWEAMWEKELRDKREGRGVDESLTSVEGVLNDWNPEMMGSERGVGPDGEEAAALVFAEPYTGPPAGSNGNGASGSRQNGSTSTSSKSSPIPSTSDDLYTHLTSSSPHSPPILSTQRRLASIAEMIHVASLLHDDVIDASPLRRGHTSAPAKFSSKLSVLGGDFLLGRASVALARLGNNEVVELLATVLANLVEGEVMQARSNPLGNTNNNNTTTPSDCPTRPSKEAFEMYMRKTYLKTASLMAKSARASVILGGCGVDVSGRGESERGGKEVREGEWVKDLAYGYGRNLGIAFQVGNLRIFIQ